jgi:adenylate cyclase
MPQDIPSRPSPIALPKAAGSLANRIDALQRWAVSEGLRGAVAYDLFAGFCRRLVKDGVPLCRAYAALETMHPQWWGFGFTWQRGVNHIKLAQFGHEHANAPSWVGGVFHHLAGRAKAGESNPAIRRRIGKGPNERDFPALERFFAAGATDYFAELFSYPAAGDPARGLGVVYSFMTDRPAGFVEDDIAILRAALPALSLAMKADAGHVSASGLLRVYLGEDAGRRVQGGGIARGAVESLRAVLWYADIRGFTALADAMPGAALVDLLDDVFETLTAALRRHGGQVLKFIGDGMLAAFPFEEATRRRTSRRALEAAAEAMLAVDALSAAREAAGKPAVVVDLALHLGEVLYGNVGAVDRLDFTMVGPTVNEVSRMEALCERLGHRVLVSAELARSAKLDDGSLISIGRYGLRGVRQDREIYALSIRRQS